MTNEEKPKRDCSGCWETKDYFCGDPDCPKKTEIKKKKPKKEAKFPISVYVTVRNGMPILEECLKRVQFADQIIVVLDRCNDGSYACAKKYATEVYDWLGSDSMAERRNFAIGFKGSDKEPHPEWLDIPEHRDNHPVIKNEWFLYLDHDELIIQNSKYPPVPEVIALLLANEEARAGAFLLTNKVSEKGFHATHSPLMRFFRTDSNVCWRKNIQNEQVHENPVVFFPLEVMHYGYSNNAYQFRKMWKRLPLLQEHVRDDPNDFQRIQYVLNNITGLVQIDRHLDEIIGYFQSVARDLYLKSGSKNERGMKGLMESCVRHFWFAMSKTGQFKTFIDEVDPVYNKIKWVPDVPWWYFNAYEQMKIPNKEKYEKLKKYGKEFIKTSERFWKKLTNIESASVGSRFIVPAILSDIYLKVGDRENADKMDKLFMEWV